MTDFVTLTCPSCGGKLQITQDIDHFACAHCGTEHTVRRTDGTISLAPGIQLQLTRCVWCGTAISPAWTVDVRCQWVRKLSKGETVSPSPDQAAVSTRKKDISEYVGQVVQMRSRMSGKVFTGFVSPQPDIVFGTCSQKCGAMLKADLLGGADLVEV